MKASSEKNKNNMVKWFLSIVISTCNFVSTAQVLTNKKIVPKEIKIKDNLQRTILDYSVTDDRSKGLDRTYC